MRWENLWDTTNVSGHHEKATASSFEDGDAERFCQTGVQEDVSPAEHISHFVVWEPSQELYSLVKVVLFDHLLQLDVSWPISTNYEVNIFELGQNFWNYTNQEIDTFPVLEARDENDVDLVRVARLADLCLPDLWVGRELIRIDGIWDGEGA